jgi:hypothetical protein
MHICVLFSNSMSPELFRGLNNPELCIGAKHYGMNAGYVWRTTATTRP